jgi:hypothetical protein
LPVLSRLYARTRKFWRHARVQVEVPSQDSTDARLCRFRRTNANAANLPMHSTHDGPRSLARTHEQERLIYMYTCVSSVALRYHGLRAYSRYRYNINDQNEKNTCVLQT